MTSCFRVGILRWIIGETLKDRMKNECIRKSVVRKKLENRLRWFVRVQGDSRCAS